MTQENKPNEKYPAWGDFSIPKMNVRVFAAIEIAQGIVSRGGTSSALIAKQSVEIADALLQRIDETNRVY